MHRYIGVLAAVLLFGTAACAATLPKESRQSIAADDGWAALTPATRGGANAKSKHMYSVRSRQELIAALNDGVYPAPKEPSNVPKIIVVYGTIDVNVDDDHRALACKDYVRDDFTIEAYVAAYDPATWGRDDPSGKVENARKASQQAQAERIRIRVGSNTTIIGASGAVIKGASLEIKNQSNVIVRHLSFVDTMDCFPQWEPRDGEGAWNSEYDFIGVRGSDHVWIDHNSFDDGVNPDNAQPHYFGKHFQVHDGAVDITEGADLVTVSWNRFLNHDKVMLIGSSDSRTADSGKLRVTLHHNLFENVGQRTPRVRYGQVHVYNNLYRAVEGRYQYSWGAGLQSQIYADSNVFESAKPLAPGKVVRVFKGEALAAKNTLLNGSEVDIVAQLGQEIRTLDWVPTLHGKIDKPTDVSRLVSSRAGPMK